MTLTDRCRVCGKLGWLSPSGPPDFAPGYCPEHLEELLAQLTTQAERIRARRGDDAAGRWLADQLDRAGVDHAGFFAYEERRR